MSYSQILYRRSRDFHDGREPERPVTGDRHIRVLTRANAMLARVSRVLKIVHLGDRHFDALSATV
jgi:hypothetical protein